MNPVATLAALVLVPLSVVFASACGGADAPLGTLVRDTIAFASCPDDSAEGCLPDVYTLSASSAVPARLTTGAISTISSTFTFAWSPDGTHIAFDSDREGKAGIYVMNADGSNLTRVSSSTGDEFFPSWSPDGSRLAFVSLRDGDPEIFVMNADGSQPTNLTENNEFDGLPAWSPDGTRIAFVSLGAMKVMNADGSGVAISPWASANYGPVWSPDSTRFVYATLSPGSLIYAVAADGSSQTQLTSGPPDDLSPSWSPDGRQIAFTSTRDGNAEIYVMNANGSGLVNLTRNPGQDFSPAWSPDGAWIAFVSKRDGNREIYVMRTDGTAQTRLTDSPNGDFAPAWSPVR